VTKFRLLELQQIRGSFMNKLDILLQDYYRGRALPQERIDAIKWSEELSRDEISVARATVESASETAFVSKPSRNQQGQCSEVSGKTRLKIHLLRYAIAASLLLALFGSLISYHLSGLHKPFHIANEIALNHYKPFKADVEGSNFTRLSESLDEVEFTIAVPPRILQKFNLLGARYCSISNQPAIHFQLVDKYTTEKSSLFMTTASKTLRQFQDDAVITEHDSDHRAHYWSNDNLFYALLSNSGEEKEFSGSF